MRVILGVLGVTAMVLGGAGAASAADMCLRDGVGRLIVGKTFLPPTAGKCKPFNGYMANTTGVITGLACGTSNGSDIRFNLHSSHFVASTIVINLTRAGMSPMSGDATYCMPDVGLFPGSCFNTTMEKVDCPANRPLL